MHSQFEVADVSTCRVGLLRCTEAVWMDSLSDLHTPGVVIIDVLRILAGCRKRRLNQVLYVFYLSMFLRVLLFVRVTFLCFVNLRWYVFFLLVVLVVSTCQVIG